MCVFDLNGNYLDRWGSDCGRYKTEQILACGKTEQTQNYYRTITNYQCYSCGKTYQYKHAASSGCGVCGGSHSVGAEGAQPGAHNPVGQYLVCGY